MTLTHLRPTANYRVTQRTVIRTHPPGDERMFSEIRRQPQRVRAGKITVMVLVQGMSDSHTHTHTVQK